MDHEQRRQRQQRSPRGNAPGSGGGSASSGKHKGAGGKGGGKKPIKVLYISNPMRVKTSAAGFRALVQELTGRDADPSKYSPDELAGVGGAGAENPTAAADIDCGAAHGFSPGGAAASCDTVVASPSPAAADHHPDDASAVAAPYGGDYDDDEEDEDGFGSSELLEHNYAVFSPPTLLYDHHPHSKELHADEILLDG
uniref:VQ domain-containing protein n=1 Tax=Setaria viridis TaxID=4556 RepID=A0A4U6UP00_SETVI|nr:hypothetical protein SEVIR_5G359300v2 [Setaria viridis]